MSRPLPEGPILLSTTFVLGLLFGEKSADRFTSALSRACIVDVNLGEVFTQVDQQVPSAPGEIAQVLSALGVTVVPLGTVAAAHFPLLKVLDLNHRVHQWAAGVPESQVKSLSLGDMACLSAALDRQLPVLTGQSYWSTLGLDLQIFDYRDPELVPA